MNEQGDEYQDAELSRGANLYSVADAQKVSGTMVIQNEYGLDFLFHPMRWVSIIELFQHRGHKHKRRSIRFQSHWPGSRRFIR